jgi:hypothetical protein
MDWKVHEQNFHNCYCLDHRRRRHAFLDGTMIVDDQKLEAIRKRNWRLQPQICFLLRRFFAQLLLRKGVLHCVLFLNFLPFPK